VCAAQEGHRTVLVDFDNYGPKMKRNFAPELASSIADIISGDSSQLNLDQALVLDQGTGVDILALGNGAQPAMACLNQQQIEKLLDALRQRYHRILIDSPPLLGLSDGRALAAFADTALFLVRWGSTNRDAAATGLQILKDSSANVLGVVMTRVHIKRHALYGQGDALQYYQSFRAYYAE
jgi:Mrp family chromosome partitioning ATPase